MKRSNLWLIGILAVVLLGVGAWAYNFVLGETEEASGPISAIPLEAGTAEAATPALEEIDLAPTVEVEPTTVPEEAPTSLPEEEEVVGGSQLEATSATGGLVVYTIQQSASQVRFNIYEELRGAPTEVVGLTDQVAGEIALDLANLAATQVGTMQVNARTLATDSDRRNQAIRNFILNTDQYEFITFEPIGVEGLSGAAKVGDIFDFQVPGSLTIRDIVLPVVFDVGAEVISEDEIRGTAATVVQREDYGLTIPSVPGVANVGEDVSIEIDFTLVPRGG